jgi:lysozyme family protein
MPPTPEATQAGYHTLWNRARIRPERTNDAKVRAQVAFKNKPKYVEIEQKTGVPWPMTAAIHERESSMNFNGVLHNGEHIIGTGQKTRLVPRGRGPFTSWPQAANDALTMPPHSLNKVKVWSVERILYECERYNGWGYLGRINSPYVWSWTTEQQPGKYIADGVWSSSAWDTQNGCAAMLKALADIDPDAKAKLERREATPPSEVVKQETRRERQTGAAGAATTASGGTSTAVEHKIVPQWVGYAAIGIGVALVIAAVVLYARKKNLLNKAWS